MTSEKRFTEYKGTYKDKYRLDEQIPHVGDLSDPFNEDGWEKVRQGYIEIFEEDGEKFAKVTEKGRAAIANVDVERGQQHHPTQTVDVRMSASSYRRQIYTIVENMYGQEFRADFVDHTPDEKKKPHKYTLYVRPRVETKGNRMQYKAKVVGTLKEIYEKLHTKLAEGMTLKVLKGKDEEGV